MVLSYSSDCSLLHTIDPSWRSMAKAIFQVKNVYTGLPLESLTPVLVYTALTK